MIDIIDVLCVFFLYACFGIASIMFASLVFFGDYVLSCILKIIYKKTKNENLKKFIEKKIPELLEKDEDYFNE